MRYVVRGAGELKWAMVSKMARGREVQVRYLELRAASNMRSVLSTGCDYGAPQCTAIGIRGPAFAWRTHPYCPILWLARLMRALPADSVGIACSNQRKSAAVASSPPPPSVRPPAPPPPHEIANVA